MAEREQHNDPETPLLDDEKPLSDTSESSASGFLNLGFSREQRTRRTIWKIIVIGFLTVLVVTVIVAVVITARRNRSILEATKYDQKLILVLSDGLRYDLFNVHMPSLTTLGEHGVRAEHMIAQYPSVSAVNMYSIATGLFPESHGVIDNNAFSLEFKNQTNGYLDTINVTYWWDVPGVEPLWVTARNMGHSTGTLMYPGGDVKINGVRPNMSLASSKWSWKNYGFKERVDIVMEWLTKNDLDLVYLYFDEPDESLHRYGIGSKEVNEKIKEVDDAIGYLQQRIKTENMEDIVNVIVVSDHGHKEIIEYIDIWDNMQEEDFDFVLKETSPRLMMQPKADKMKEVFNKLQNISDYVTPYYKENIPDRFHYKDNDRVLSVLLNTDLGYVIQGVPGANDTTTSSHGWDPSNPEIFSIFYAKGPAFKDNFVSKPFQNVDIYPLMCKLLDITPRPNNGTLDVVKHMLK